MSELEKPAVLFVPSDDFDARYFDPAAFEAVDIAEPLVKRPRTNERGNPPPPNHPALAVMIYVKKPEEEHYTALHLSPPSLQGLYQALYQKYRLEESKVSQVLKKCLKGGVTVKVDDDMIRHYSNQDTFLLEVEPAVEDPSYCTVTLLECITSNVDCRTPLGPSWTGPQ